MLDIITLPVGQLRTNCYLLVDKKSKDCLIIDPGDDGGFIIEYIEREDLKPLKIIATHGHFDHIMGIMELKLNYGIPFLMHKKDIFLVGRMRSSAKHFLGYDPGPSPAVEKYLKEGDLIKIGKETLEVVKTPGHTPGSISLYSKQIKSAFVGDLIFSEGGIGRYDFEYANKELLLKSIKKVLKWYDETIIYPGHGDRFELSEAKLFF